MEQRRLGMSPVSISSLSIRLLVNPASWKARHLAWSKAFESTPPLGKSLSSIPVFTLKHQIIFLFQLLVFFVSGNLNMRIKKARISSKPTISNCVYEKILNERSVIKHEMWLSDGFIWFYPRVNSKRVLRHGFCRAKFAALALSHIIIENIAYAI